MLNLVKTQEIWSSVCSILIGIKHEVMPKSTSLQPLYDHD